MNTIYNIMIDKLVMFVSIFVLIIYLSFYFLTLWWIFSKVIKMSIS